VTELAESLKAQPGVGDRQLQLALCSQPVWIQGDKDKLKQVFINLISNACEAVLDGEVVSWSITLKDNHSHVQVRVHNGGDPIPPDILPKLTKPFFTTKSSGNGLGLAITKRIVEAHDGSLAIESTPQCGTTVTVCLPCQQIVHHRSLSMAGEVEQNT